jgi:hypothetical protein
MTWNPWRDGDDGETAEQEREREAREECDRRGIDPDELCADGGVLAWMVVDREMSMARPLRPPPQRVLGEGEDPF